LYLLADELGDITQDGRGLGLYQLDTRVLSCAFLRLNGHRPTLLRAHVAANDEGVIQLTNPELRVDPTHKLSLGSSLRRRSVGLVRHRRIDEGLYERITVTNHSRQGERIVLELAIDADAADIFEVRGYPRSRRGVFRPPQVTGDRVIFSYEGLDRVMLRTVVEFPEVDAERTATLITNGAEGTVAVRWSVLVDPGAVRTVEWRAWGERGRARRRRQAPAESTAEDRSMTAQTVSIEADGELLEPTIRRSLADLQLLANDGPSPGEHYTAAGVPWFATLFGRDAVIAALEALPFVPELAPQTLEVLGARQSQADDPDTDADVGKILHELRSGEMVRTGELPYRPYYGSVDATPLWLILLAETFDWTGDLELVRRWWPTARAALTWLDGPGDRDGDGFVEYERRAPNGLVNQGWKDSGDAIVFRDGRLASAPIALAEVQGYAYDARRRMANLARRLGEDELGSRLDRAAEALLARFDAAFWLDDVGFYALALDREKRAVDGIGSNPGHCLWSGLVASSRVEPVARRIRQPDMDSGWGIRTLASGQVAYDPIGYHTGSVWPHDTALIAAGLKRYGRHHEAATLATHVFEAARHSPLFRLPELICGFDRASTVVPIPYPVACSPQAWAAAAPLSLLRTMLGLRADAAARILELERPLLPSWLPRLTLRGLRVGDATIDLLFHRWRGTTSAEVLQRTGDVEVVIRI
jgi:glycogen debranching enzyme